MSAPTKTAATRMPKKVLHHPTVTAQIEHRAGDLQLKVADAITSFAGSMMFVYLHIVVFAGWMLFIEKSPWPTLTLVVSLEAIFLSTFVMIGQNRAAAFQQHKADHDFVEQELELKTNTDLTRQIHVLTEELHKRLLSATPGGQVVVQAADDSGAGAGAGAGAGPTGAGAGPTGAEPTA